MKVPPETILLMGVKVLNVAKSDIREKKRAVKCLAAKCRGGKLFGKIKFLLAAKFSSPPCYSVISSCTRSKMRFVPSNRNQILNFVCGYVSLAKCFCFSLDRAALSNNLMCEISQERWNGAYSFEAAPPKRLRCL